MHKMRSACRGNRDPMERQIERALCTGEFIREGACFSFVSGLEQVANGVVELITTEPARSGAGDLPFWNWRNNRAAGDKNHEKDQP